MTLYMPPIARKKRVDGRYNPDSFRVISADAENTHERFSPPPPTYEVRPKETMGLSLPNIYDRNTQVLPKSVPDYRIHRPHPESCGFLRHNVRILNEPICSVYTSSTHPEQDQWWPSRTSDEPLDKPPKTVDTTYRNDFVDDIEKKPRGSARHTSNPNKEPALGTVPVNFLAARDGNKRFYKEEISHEHQYNCRMENNYPIRAKRHGSFVWRQMGPETSKKFVEYHLQQDAAESSEQKSSLDQQEPVSASPIRVVSSAVSTSKTSDTQTPSTGCEEENVKKTVTFQSPVTASKTEQDKS